VAVRRPEARDGWEAGAVNISIARHDAVAALDAFVGPKA
jgi:hypothetical protein